MYEERGDCLISKSAFAFEFPHLTYYKYCIEFICSICSSWKISNQKEEEKEKEKEREKRKNESVKLGYVGKMLTKDEIYCSYFKLICLSMEKYYKNPDECLRNYKMK